MNNYELMRNWPKLPSSLLLGNPTGIALDTHHNIFIFHRANRKWPVIGSMPKDYISAKTILELDRNTGELLNIWGENFFIMPHGLTVDVDNNIWVTDVGLHQVFKFSHSGKLLLQLGESKVAGNDSGHFNRPTDVAVTKDGSFYVSDGYGNSRIVKFSATGKYLFEWGKKGDRDGEFNLPHAVDLDEKENVYVADRENNRVQVFDSTGKFITAWKRNDFGKISSVVFDKITKGFVAVDFSTAWFGLKHNGSDIILFDSAGNVTDKFGKNLLKKEGVKCWYHNVVIDDQGDIYVTDILGNTIQKFRKLGTVK
ncbi:MAG: peptidyl-alpha-hydroxyglycine alpha-amidating lyase family protein [Ferruginibacter sp.]